MRRAGAVSSLTALLAGCFPDLTDRRCDGSQGSCFTGEICTSGRCVTVVGLEAGVPERAIVHVEAFRRGDDAPVTNAQINGSRAGNPCNCQPSDADETACAFEIESGAAQTFCAVVRGYEPCAVSVPPAALRDGARITLVLSPCDAPDCTSPLPCDCATVPACVAEEAP